MTRGFITIATGNKKYYRLANVNLNAYRDCFAQADDFTGCGTNYLTNSKKGFFQDGQLGKYNGRA